MLMLHEKEATDNPSKKDLEALAVLLDSKFTGPLGVKFGLDALIGLIPGIGSSITSLLSAYILLRAILMGYPLAIILKMLINIAIDSLLELFPFVGDILDFFVRSNVKNINLMKQYDKESERTERKSLLEVTALLFVVFLSIALLASGAFYVTSLLFSWMFS